MYTAHTKITAFKILSENFMVNFNDYCIQARPDLQSLGAVVYLLLHLWRWSHRSLLSSVFSPSFFFMVPLSSSLILEKSSFSLTSSFRFLFSSIMSFLISSSISSPDQSIKQWDKQSINQYINQSTDQYISETNNQSMNTSISHKIMRECFMEIETL